MVQASRRLLKPLPAPKFWRSKFRPVHFSTPPFAQIISATSVIYYDRLNKNLYVCNN